MIELIVLTMMARPTPILIDWELMARAQTRAEYLCEHDQWSHDGWKDSFEGIAGVHGENLAKDFTTPKAAHKALMESPTHKRNIQDRRFNKIGVGKSCGIYVQLFST